MALYPLRQITLCWLQSNKDKDNVAAEYALGGLSNQIFASKYTLYIPDKQRLIKEVEAIIEEWHEEQ